MERGCFRGMPLILPTAASALSRGSPSKAALPMECHHMALLSAIGLGHPWGPATNTNRERIVVSALPHGHMDSSKTEEQGRDAAPMDIKVAAMAQAQAVGSSMGGVPCLAHHIH